MNPTHIQSGRDHKSVALIYAATSSSDVQVMEGVAAYAAANCRWEFFIEEKALHEQRLPDFATWKGDGIIFNSDNESMLREVVESGLPAVAYAGKPPRGISSVGVDNKKIAALAFEHLRALGFRHFAYFGSLPDKTNGWSRERESAFRRLAESLGNNLPVWQVAQNHTREWDVFFDRASQWIKTLPKPCGILADSDRRGRLLLEVCRACHIRVPGEISVIGVDNDPLLCGLCSPQLTSIDPGFRLIGWKAAEILDLRMRQGTKTPWPVQTVVLPLAVTTRASTDILKSSDPAAVRALQLIERHPASGTSPEAVCREVGLSRSGLDTRLKSSFGLTLSGAILKTRLSRASEMISGTTLPLKEIAQTCGFSSVQHMTTLFRKRLGVTPAALRKIPVPGDPVAGRKNP